MRRLVVVLLVGAGLLSMTGCVADAPPLMGTAIGGDSQAIVSWTTPLGDYGLRVAKYKVTPFIGSVAQTPVVFNSTATTQTVTGLTNGTTYTFAVQGIDALGNESASSERSNPITYTRPPATAVTGGAEHSCAALADGTVRCWGGNDFGRLGNGIIAVDGSADSSVPVSVAGIADATATITAGFSHSCALLGGPVTCWGDGSHGQLGNGMRPAASTAVSVLGISDATAITASSLFHSCAVLAGGTAKCWGYNVFGQLGNGFSGTSAESSSPVSVTGITDATSIAAGYAHSCARLSGGTVKCWGYNSYGQLGNGTTANSSTPVTVTGITDAIAITAGGYHHSCALLSGGTVKCWGHNGYGQLGNGTTVDSSTPVTVTGLTDTIAITVGALHSCALLSGGTVKCWGYNGYGELGDGTNLDSSSPVSVTGLTDAAAITNGNYHSCAVLAGGTVSCWGSNTKGQLGNGTSSNSNTPMPVSGW
jgi:alpha-tubulin suppressor-like RCC1 family protein